MLYAFFSLSLMPRTNKLGCLSFSGCFRNILVSNGGTYIMLPIVIGQAYSSILGYAKKASRIFVTSQFVTGKLFQSCPEKLARQTLQLIVNIRRLWPCKSFII
jgi:hypothetical protein